MKYFLEVAASQHVTRSAEKLHIAQPALTQAIHRLEKELNVPLFVSRGRNIVLTEYGKFLQKKLTPLLEELDEIPELFAGFTLLRIRHTDDCWFDGRRQSSKHYFLLARRPL